MSEAARWARTFVRALAEAGVRDVVVSPGSRSTALVLAAAGQEDFRLHSVIDERSAGFFALGQSRVTGRPTVLVCTSGTAGAHYYPAVIEASMARVPLVVVTADRPPELQASAAPQTIDQIRLYGAHARAFHDLGLPNDDPTAHAAVRRKAAQAVARSEGPVAGPVHINVPARKPFESEAGDDALPGDRAPSVLHPSVTVDPGSLDPLVERLTSAKRPLFVAGPAPIPWGAARRSVADLAQRADAALYAETTSQLRFGVRAPGDGLGVLLSGAPFARRFEPDLIVQLGAPPVSGAWQRWRALRPDIAHVCVAEHEWPDPAQRSDLWVAADPVAVVEALRTRIPARGTSKWRDRMAGWDRRAWGTVDRVLPAGAEGEVVRIVRGHLPADSFLMVGNSLSVRHFDTYCRSGGEPVQVLHQRGASGIDGLVAGAVGAASSADRPVTLVLGDVSLAHDVGSLALAQAVSTPLLIIVLDNGGGRIFEFLPAGRRYGQQPVFEHFITPPKADPQTLAAAFGLCHVRVEGGQDLPAALTSAYRVGTTTVVQVKLPDHGARAVADAVTAGLEAEFGPRGMG